MIAAKRLRTGGAPRRLARLVRRGTRRLDRAANRTLERAHEPLRRLVRGAGATAGGSLAWLGPRLRPPVAAGFRALAHADAAVRRACGTLVRGASAASAVLSPRAAIGLTIAAAGLLLAASQFLEYRVVEIGQPGYGVLDGIASPPAVDGRTAGEAHAYVLAPLGLIAAALGLAGARRERPRAILGVVAIGLVSLLVIGLVDRPAGLDEGAETARFAGASAVLTDGFYAELAAAGGLLIAGLLYYARPCRIRISSSGRAASARRRRPRRPDSSPARVARSA
jgi:hypothetical protein